ncbi:MAG: chemotaxis protein CheA [Eubacterium sp.]|nr:chemotaxis protein CheA [Eubacterium sp.]
MDTSQYLDLFIDETKEHLQSLNENVLELEKDPDNSDTVNEIFRAAHTLKGMAGTMGFARMQRLTHDLENVFSEIRNGTMKANAKLIDVLFRGLDALEGYLNVILSDGNEGTEDNEDIINDLNAFLESGGAEEGAPAEEPKEEAAPAEEEPAKEEPVAEPAAPASSGDPDKMRFREIRVNDSDINAMKTARDEGKNVYGITVFLQESCVLKSARAFLVFKSVDEKGELVKSVPTTEQIEDEEFEFDFSWILVTSEGKEEIKNMIMNVSEVDSVYIDDFIIPSAATENEDGEPLGDIPTEAAPTATSAPAASSGSAPAAAASSASAKAPAASAAQSDDKKKSSGGGKGKIGSRSVRVDIDKLDELMNLVSELIIAKNGLVSASSNGDAVASDNQAFNDQIEYLERITTNLHESVMKVRMVPIESVVNRFPRMIRDLNRKLGKKMELYMTGEETELDRTVIDEIGDPLMHLLRNSADHGLESNEERVKLGKPEEGSIFLDAFQDGNNVVIEVRDDGAGINIDKVRNKAIEKGVISEKQAETMSEKDFIDLLFQPSFSTADKITDVSGRGVGLDVVRTKIEALGGSISAKTTAGEGSTFTIQLPLTLAIIQALMVEVLNEESGATEKYAIPLSNIQGIEDVPRNEIRYVQNKEVINLRGSVIPIIRAHRILDLDDLTEEPDAYVVVIMQKGDQRVGMIVDRLIGQQETVIKSLGRHITNDKLFSGATILGDGEVALIFDTNTLI